jgi:hypothetical protein
MVSWHIPLAISGQQGDLSNATNRTPPAASQLISRHTCSILQTEMTEIYDTIRCDAIRFDSNRLYSMVIRRNGAGSLSFAPKLSAPYSLPFMLPGVLGSISSPMRDSYTVVLTVGELTLHFLSVDGSKAPGDIVRLSTSVPVAWNVTTQPATH